MDQIVLVHLSDMHIGDIVDNSTFKGDEGFFAHDIALCTNLGSALEDVYRITKLDQKKPFHVAFSGDLTAKGSPNEFDMGHTFFLSRWNLDAFHDRVAGLRLSPGRLCSVAGNHDHWNGGGQWYRFFRPPAYNKTIYDHDFPASPAFWPIASTEEGLQLVLVGLDSNAGLADKNTNLRARGRFDSKELKRLKEILKAWKEKPLTGKSRRRVTALMTHHCISPQRERARWHNLKEARQLDDEIGRAHV